MNCSCEALDSCNVALAQSEAEAQGLCSTEQAIDYNLDLHILAVFVILCASCFGAAIPLLIKHNPDSRIDPFLVILGKCLGTGVVLAAAFIHMLSPASTSLASPCLSQAFQDYPFAFLYALISMLLMHLLESTVEAVMMSTFESDQSNSLELVHQPIDNAAVVPTVNIDPLPAKHHHLQSSHSHTHDFGGHSHFLSILQVKRTIAAYLLEFGVTSHSVIIGIQNGVVSAEELRRLLIALSFHQLFEGVALGARLADADLTHWNEFFLALLFSISAPIGIAIGIIISSSINPNGADYLQWQGTFDAVCSGILLYIGAMLLIKDVEKYRAKQPWRRAMMFVALYIGAGVMAFIGVYL